MSPSRPFRTLPASCLGGLLMLAIAVAGCKPADPYGPLIQFKDEAPANAQVAAGELAELTFQDAAGRDVALKQYRGKKNVVLVVTRGFVGSADPEAHGTGSFCTYCSTQTSRLIANYNQFRKRDAEILLVFPVVRAEDRRAMNTFATMAQNKDDAQPDDVPFPVVLDLELAAVSQLGIRDDLSKPATYILDKQGEVCYAYVGQSLSDRPSVKAMLDQLDSINRR